MRTATVYFAGHDFIADADRALVWPRERALLIADLHLGKSHVFRNAGIALPEGNDHQDLKRLATLLAAHRCERLWMLGDIVHGATAEDAPWRDAWARFARAHRELSMTAITGNHDRHDRNALGATAAIAGELELGALQMRHEIAPDGITGQQGFQIAGHLHPIAIVRDGAQRYRLPCFWIRPRELFMPAFGSTTRGQVILPQAGERVLAVSPAGLIDVVNARPDRSRAS